MIKIRIRETDKVITFMTKLPKRIEKELSKTNLKFMEDLRDGAKARAPVDTGSLKESIVLLPVKKGKNVKKWQLSVDAPYAMFQEEGFTPHSFFAGGAFNSSKLAPGTTYYVSKWTPFVKPAFDNLIKTYPNKLNSAMNTALKN
jgi:hypothetical protein